MPQPEPVWKAPTDADAPAEPPAPRVPAGAAWLSGCLATGALLVVCCGGPPALILRASVDVRVAELEREVTEVRERKRVLDQTEGLLDEVAERLRMEHFARREFPVRLPQAPPEDGWGTPLRYERGGPDSASLRSAGPDRAFGTADDLGRDLDER